MKDKQEHHQQQDPTTTSQQAAFYSLSCTYFPLSFEALWNFNVTLSVANGKCRILHNDLDIPYMQWRRTYGCSGCTCTHGFPAPPRNYTYRVINLILPNSRPLLPHFFTNKQASFFGAFNPEFWSILIFEIRFLIFKNLIFSPKS